MRIRPLALDDAPELLEPFDVVARRLATGTVLGARVGEAVVDQVEGELVAVTRE